MEGVTDDVRDFDGVRVGVPEPVVVLDFVCVCEGVLVVDVVLEGVAVLLADDPNVAVVLVVPLFV